MTSGRPSRSASGSARASSARAASARRASHSSPHHEQAELHLVLGAAERGGEFAGLPVVADRGGVLAPPSFQHGQAAERDRLAPALAQRRPGCSAAARKSASAWLPLTEVERPVPAQDPGDRAHPRMRVTDRLVEDVSGPTGLRRAGSDAPNRAASGPSSGMIGLTGSAILGGECGGPVAASPGRWRAAACRRPAARPSRRPRPGRSGVRPSSAGRRARRAPRRSARRPRPSCCAATSTSRARRPAARRSRRRRPRPRRGSRRAGCPGRRPASPASPAAPRRAGSWLASARPGSTARAPPHLVLLPRLGQPLLRRRPG